MIHPILMIIWVSAASTLDALPLAGSGRGFPTPTGVVFATRTKGLFQRDSNDHSVHPPSHSSRMPFVINLSLRSAEQGEGLGDDVRGGVNGNVASCSSSSESSDEEVGRNTKPVTSTTPQNRGGDPPFVHHVAIQTANITRSIDFYSLFGYDVSCRFRAGPARAAWLELGRSRESGSGVDSADSTPFSAAGCRLELIEVPSYLFGTSTAAPLNNATLPGPPARQFRAVDAFSRPTYLGYHHVALDVTSQVRNLPQSTSSSSGEASRAARSIGGNSLRSWIDHLNSTSVQRFGKSVRVALAPKQQIVGTSVYELAFLYDDSGCLVELLNRVSERNRPVDSGWEPWDGKGFSGTKS
jgi:catechol 2,3-dioxygenase-like lactoylglutathione lyase family enzyme